MSNNLKYNLYNLYKIPSHLLSIPRVNMNVCCDCLTVGLWTNLLSKIKEWLKVKQNMKCINIYHCCFQALARVSVCVWTIYLCLLSRWKTKGNLELLSDWWKTRRNLVLFTDWWMTRGNLLLLTDEWITRGNLLHMNRWPEAPYTMLMDEQM